MLGDDLYFYVETDAPYAPKILAIPSANYPQDRDYPYSIEATDFADVEYINKSIAQVDGGFLIRVTSFGGPGTYTLYLMDGFSKGEDPWGQWWYLLSWYETKLSQVMDNMVKVGKITMEDCDVYFDQWYDNAIEKATNASMTKQEKMQAICAYVKEHSRYPTFKSYESLKARESCKMITDIGYNYTKSVLRLDSSLTGEVMCEFGRRIDYPLQNGWIMSANGEVPVGYHAEAYSAEDDTWYQCLNSHGYPFEMHDVTKLKVYKTFSVNG